MLHTYFQTDRIDVCNIREKDKEKLSQILLDKDGQDMSGDYFTEDDVENVLSSSCRPQNNQELFQMYHQDLILVGIYRRYTDEIIGYLQFSIALSEWYPNLSSVKSYANLAFGLDKHYWGQKIMPEVLSQALKYFIPLLKIDGYVAVTQESNTRCQSVLDKSGFGQLGKSQIDGQRCFTYIKGL